MRWLIRVRSPSSPHIHTQPHQHPHAKQEAALLEASTSRSGHITNNNKRSQPQEGKEGKGNERPRGLSVSGAGSDSGGAFDVM